ncbi:vitamin K-dependent gamma-carboxylase [Anopheles bellator]|uniref:vitamin K-dependent gamma-carboxylase n=1 Tax=Anopheles bellator TaxID=139047 RepID=UPI002648A9D0|nr:vitamin K-dependent gamma-carboxylase [Anopheles bellator]
MMTTDADDGNAAKDSTDGSPDRKVDRFLRSFIGHDLRCVSSFDGFVNRCMYRPVDGAALGVARILFGLAMLIDIPEERGGGDLDLRWGEPRDCRFPLIHSMEPPTLPRMGLVYGLMWLGAAGMALGYRFRVSTAAFAVTYWYVFLLDKSAWNNHSYLYGLLGTLFLFTDAHRCCSIDAWRDPASSGQCVPFWNYFILKFQFFVLYFIAGLKKLCHEWLSGYAMTNLSYHWVFVPFRAVLGAQLTDLLIIHWFGCLFDTTVVFFLIYAPTRRVATVFASAFHLMNSRLFHIGMFPWVCLTQLPLYYSASWPRRILSREPLLAPVSARETEATQDTWGSSRESCEQQNHRRRRKRWKMAIMLAYCSLQLFLPYSHFLSPGYNNWTNGLYGYSWDMMVHAWDTTMIGVRVEDRNNPGRVQYVAPYAFTDNDRWTKHADMAIQFARCVERNVQLEKAWSPERQVAPRPVTNISVYFDIWCSMNGRFQQRIFNPNVDILRAPWSPFESVDWVLPLLQQLTVRRTDMRRLTDTVLGWSNHSDVMFIADFPGLTLRNYVANELYNVSLTVLNGTVRVETDTDNAGDTFQPKTAMVLKSGQSVPVRPGSFHAIETIGRFPSCYMYTYVNRTKELLEENSDDVKGKRSVAMLPLREEFLHRWENFVRFTLNVGNSFLYEFYGVPMPRRLKELVLEG